MPPVAESPSCLPFTPADTPHFAGLTDDEAKRRLQKFGPNTLAQVKRGAWIFEVLESLADPMALMLALAGGVYLALGERTQGAILLLALIPVLAVDVLLEARSRAALKHLASAVAPRARVVRNGIETEIATEEIVPDDVLALHEGDVVHADARVIEASNLAVDESQLTGESEPCNKSPAAVGGEGDSASRIFAGSRVLTGQGYARVEVTGAKTRFGNIARMLSEVPSDSTPLQRRTSRMVRWMAAAAIGIAIGLFALGMVRGTSTRESFLYAITFAMAAVGEEFPLVLTLFLTLGAWRLSRFGVLVRRIASVETLGSTTVICVDKTGTLTAGQFTLGVHTPVGNFSERDLLADAALACEPHPADVIERTIVGHCAEHGVDIAALYDRWQLVHDYDFDPAGKHMSHVWSSAGDGSRIVAKGALEGILEHCDVTAAERSDATLANAELAKLGLRVLAVAERNIDSSGPTGDRKVDERGLKIVGLLGFSDPVRPAVPEAIADCQRAGIRLKLVTGDHALTAHAVANATGLMHRDDAIMTGDSLDLVPPGRFAATVLETDIFARIRPEQKFAIVDTLMRSGEIVAMTGDGINDAPALKRADIGVAMGRRGTEVARAAADIVLLNDDFTSLVATVREGRHLFANLEQAFRYLLGFHVMLVATALAVPIANLPILLTPLALVWLELIVHPVSAFAFEGADPG
ncbi:MAG TPA: HAD-IC family P-type ATPase, partial [Candidatus Binataceae bacterium]|nr:HAD-IC family P-type ATPase [Candidatus Binataceae bacterium]